MRLIKYDYRVNLPYQNVSLYVACDGPEVVIQAETGNSVHIMGKYSNVDAAISEMQAVLKAAANEEKAFVFAGRKSEEGANK